MKIKLQQMGKNKIGHLYLSDDGLKVIQSVDKTTHGELQHVSVSRNDRYPSWDEIVAVKDQFFGDDKDAVMHLPRKSQYVNLHPNCFHIWELPEKWGE